MPILSWPHWTLFDKDAVPEFYPMTPLGETMNPNFPIRIPPEESRFRVPPEEDDPLPAVDDYASGKLAERARCLDIIKSGFAKWSSRLDDDGKKLLWLLREDLRRLIGESDGR